MSMAALGREAVRIIQKVTKRGYMQHYVNRTAKYVSIKVCTEHLTEAQKARVIKALTKSLPDRFLGVVTNSTSNCSAWRGYDSVTWQEPKVLVRFSQ